MTELKSCRLEKKLTQAEAAERLGVSLAMVGGFRFFLHFSLSFMSFCYYLSA